jgi:hypothetical protein
MVLTSKNHRAIERAFPHGSQLTKQEPGFPAVTGYTYQRGKSLLFVTHDNVRNASPLTKGAIGTTFSAE